MDWFVMDIIMIFIIIIIKSGFILCMRPANKRWHYIVMLSLIGWVHSQDDPCKMTVIMQNSNMFYKLYKAAYVNSLLSCHVMDRK